jgi:hypothetical protein
MEILTMREGNKPDDLWVAVQILIAFARLGRLVYRRPCLASGVTRIRIAFFSIAPLRLENTMEAEAAKPGDG